MAFDRTAPQGVSRAAELAAADFSCELTGIRAHGAKLDVATADLVGGELQEPCQRGELLIAPIIEVGGMEPQMKDTAGTAGAAPIDGTRSGSYTIRTGR